MLAIMGEIFILWFYYTTQVSTVFIYLLDYKKDHTRSAPYPFCSVEIEMVI